MLARTLGELERYGRARLRLLVRGGSAYGHGLSGMKQMEEPAMAKGQKRGNREAKKPKADKKKPAPSPGTVTTALAKPKPAAAAPPSKK